LLLAAGPASAQPVSGPREDVNQQFTTRDAGSPTGLGFTARYHAADDPHANPPYLLRMITDPPGRMRFDTGVPPRCTAPDPVLQAIGPAACPAGSRLGGGHIEGRIIEPVAHDVAFDHFRHHVDLVNGPDEQILLIHSEGYTVVRGHIRSDGSVAWNTPPCFPSPPTGKCVDDYVLQLRSSVSLRPYTRTVNGRVRSYASTPPKCPRRGYWKTRVRIWWRDGSVDRVASHQPCRHRRR
jgi:hypothetical protein